MIKAGCIRIGAPADAVLRFQHQAGKAAHAKRSGGGNASDPRPHDQYLNLIAHAAPSGYFQAERSQW
jgi:hypothetical protein